MKLAWQAGSMSARCSSSTCPLDVINDNSVLCVDLGHGGPGTVSESGCSILPRRRLLHSGLRCHRSQHVQDPGELAWRVSHPGVSTWCWTLSIRCHWQQDWPQQPSRKHTVHYALQSRDHFLNPAIQDWGIYTGSQDPVVGLQIGHFLFFIFIIKIVHGVQKKN